jgi:hypothetical protein
MSARSPHPRSRRTPVALREDGLTIVEVMVAGLILVIGALALMNLVNASARNTFRSEQSQVVSNRLQAEVERIKQLPYSEIALTTVPANSTDPQDPNWRVSGTNLAVQQDGTLPYPLVYNGSALNGGGTVTEGQIDPTPANFQDGDVKGKIYRYVVWDQTCSNCPSSSGTKQGMKRLIVAVKLNKTASGGTRAYQELQSQIVDPEAKPDANTGPPPGGENTVPWTYWLTDTPCNFSTRQPITADHLTHNTRGACRAGLKNGNNPGAPDLMLTEAPPLTTEQPLFDYATDVEPAQDPTLDKGLALRRGSSCNSVSSLWGTLPLVPDLLDPTMFQKVHKWVGREIPGGFNNILLSGKGTLSLWTQTVGGAVYPGKICAWLFVRTLNILNDPVDTPVFNLDLTGGNYFEYTQNPWPNGGWTEVTVPINFGAAVNGGAVPLLPDSRLGLAISVDSSTGADGLQFMYDEPSFDSRLQVETTGSLPF